jgi:catechol 2,3-dioxygenase
MVRKDDAMTTIGPVTLTVADATRLTAFYTERLGFAVHAHDGPAVRLGAGGDDLLVLVEDRDAPSAPGTAGLFHFAVLVPSRPALALALAKLVETRTRLQGAADHLVSEALYLADPEGNGIEIYRDRPRETWVREGGQIKMTTDPLDVDTLYDEGAPVLSTWNGLPEGTIIGHIHLRVAQIAPAEHFYCDELGMQLNARYGKQASFVALGDYHHHVAFNTWGGVGAPLPPPGALGLREFGLKIDGGTPGVVTDPSGHAVRLTKR